MATKNLTGGLQGDLFAAKEPPYGLTSEPSEPISFYPKWLSESEADDLFNRSLVCPWAQNSIQIARKSISVPRREVMYGDDSYKYVYSGVVLEAAPWPGYLKQVRDRIEKKTGSSFQVVIGNHYRGGQDSIGWHADDKPGIPRGSAIASLSLGAGRKFYWRNNETKEKSFVYLGHGDLLVMQPGFQESFEHCVPKTSQNVGARVNWTFRAFEQITPRAWS